MLEKIKDKLLVINDSPEAIAGGAAIGMWIGIMPLVGLQMPLAAVAATLCRTSRIAAMVIVWITNPFTVIPIYWMDYYFGVLLMNIFTSFDSMTKDEFVRGFSDIGDLFSMGTSLLLPMLLGGCVLGMLFGIPTYFVTIRLVIGHRIRRAEKKMDKLKKKLDEEMSEDLSTEEKKEEKEE